MPLDKYLYAIGGQSTCECRICLRAATRYETILDTWEKIADIQEARHSAFGAAADEKVFIAGGYASVGLECMSQTCEMYNVRGVATCTHVRTCVPEKKDETKQNNRNTKQTANKPWLKKAQSLHRLPSFFKKRRRRRSIYV